MEYAVPLLMLFIFGIIWAYLIYRFIGPNIFEDFWFEKSLFGWGWSTRTVAVHKYAGLWDKDLRKSS